MYDVDPWLPDEDGKMEVNLGMAGFATLVALSMVGAFFELPWLSLSNLLKAGLVGGPVCGFLAAREGRIAGAVGGLVVGLVVPVVPRALPWLVAQGWPDDPQLHDAARLLAIPLTVAGTAPGFAAFAWTKRRLGDD